VDLIYMNANKEDIGVAQDATLDLAFGSGENDFECKIASVNHCCKEGYFLYYEGTEYGGIVDDIYINTDKEEITYHGKTWHGMMNAKVIEPLKDTDENGDGVTVHKGGKNLLDCSGLKEATINGVTFTPVYNNGQLEYIVANGTATENANYVLANKETCINRYLGLKGQRIAFNGCPAGGSRNNYTFIIQGFEEDGIGIYDMGSGAECTVVDFSDFKTVQIFISVRAGYTANNLQFYPMIRLASDSSSEYQPYRSLLNEYLMLSGDANAVMAWLIERMGLSALFMASTDASGININRYKMNRYIGGYDGIRKMLRASRAKLNISFADGFVELSAKPVTDYSKDEQFDTDQINFDIKKRYHPLNHVICLGKGDLAEREVIHVYADAEGNISDSQVFFGIEEVAETYENANTESSEELRQGGIDRIKESWEGSEVNFDFDANEISYDIGDIVGAKERMTGIEVNAEITKKIVKIQDNTTTISYKVGE